MTVTPQPETDASQYATRRARRAAERAAELTAAAAELTAAETDAPIAAPSFLTPAEAEPRHRGPRPHRIARPAALAKPAHRSARRRRPVARVLLSGFAMLVAVGLAVSLSLPGTTSFGGSAVAATTRTVASDAAASAVRGSSQSVQVGSDALAAAGSPSDRDAFAAMTYAEVIRAQYAGQTFRPTFVPTAGAVRWPFSYPVAISAPYGYSSGYRFGWHDGIDFIPGVGAPISVIADGVVIQVGWNGDLGYSVQVQHNIGGHTVISIYGHMIANSSDVYPGQQIKVGTVLGLTGDTGLATGPHLHLGIKVDGQFTDPYVWLTMNATNGN